MQESLEKLTTRQYTQLEELEIMRGKIGSQGNTSNRYRNQSSERSSFNVLDINRERIRTQDSRQSQSVEKGLNTSNLKVQNNQVDQLINQWNQQKQQCSSMNSSVVQVICKNIFSIIYFLQKIEEQPEFESPQIRSPLIVHEEEDLQEPESPQKLHNGARKPSGLSLNQVKVPNKFQGTHTQRVQQQIDGQLSFDRKKTQQNQNQPSQSSANNIEIKREKKMSGNYATNGARPQTTKASNTNNNSTIQKKKEPIIQKQPIKNPMKMSQYESVQIEKENSSLLQSDSKQSVPQTPQQRKVQPAIDKGKRQSTKQQPPSSSKKTSQSMEENTEGRLIIHNMIKFKQQILQLYEKQFSQSMQHSSNIISKQIKHRLDSQCAAIRLQMLG